MEVKLLLVAVKVRLYMLQLISNYTFLLVIYM